MIEIRQVGKQFGKIEAVADISLDIQEANVFGMVGTNGAGKSTLMRMMSGVLKPDQGTILIDGDPVWENPEAKQKLFYISDDSYWFSNAMVKDLIQSYQTFYPEFDEKRFREYLILFGLDANRKIQTFSKGMKKQLSILIGICSNAKYLLCDETFDGLDPVMRQNVKKLMASEMESRGLTPIIASHNLRELEDICDHVGLLHKGGVLLSKDLEDLKCNLQKVQCVFTEESEEALRQDLDILKFERKGRLVTMTVRGERDEIMEVIQEYHPIYSEVLPLSLEEIFIDETEVVGYDIKNLLF